MCQCRFISCNKCTTLAGDVDNWGGYACVGAGGKLEISVPSPQFCCEAKTSNSIEKKRGHIYKTSNTCLAHRKYLPNISYILFTDDIVHFKHHSAVRPPCGIYLACLLTVKGSDIKNHEPMSGIIPVLVAVLLLPSNNNHINDDINHSEQVLNISVPAFSYMLHTHYSTNLCSEFYY